MILRYTLPKLPIKELLIGSRSFAKKRSRKRKTKNEQKKLEIASVETIKVEPAKIEPVKVEQLKEEEVLTKSDTKEVLKALDFSKIEHTVEKSMEQEMLRRLGFERLIDSHTSEIFLRKLKHGSSVAVRYKPTELIAKDIKEDLGLIKPYADLIEDTKVELANTKLNPLDIIYAPPTDANLLYESVLIKTLQERKNPTKKPLTAKVGFSFVINDEQFDGLIADCTTESSFLDIKIISCRNDIRQGISKLKGKGKHGEDFGQNFSTVPPLMGEWLIRYLEFYGLSKELLVYIENSSLSREHAQYINWLQQMKEFIKKT